MRVPTMTLFSKSTYQLGNLSESLTDINEVISTGKKLNDISDDPVGYGQVVDLRASISNLKQIDRNLEMGRTWLTGSETALNTVGDQIVEAKLLSSRMISGAVNAQDRMDSVEAVDGFIEQIYNMANKKINGNYIFSGTKTNLQPFSYDDANNPGGVIYEGNNMPFVVKSGGATDLEVGRDGEAVFYEDEILVNSTNNRIVFREDPDLGEDQTKILEAVIPDGMYTKDQLASTVQEAMNQTSRDNGYGITYDASYDRESQTFTILDDGKYDGYFGFDLLWDTGDSPRISGISTSAIVRDDLDITINNEAALLHGTPEPHGTKPIRVTWEGNGKWSVLNDPGYDLPTEIVGTEESLELDLNGDGDPDITLTLGTAAIEDGFVEFDIIPISEDNSLGPDLGFRSGDVSSIPPVSDGEVTLKHFDATNNIIDFEEVVGAVTSTLSIAIPEGDYSDMDELAQVIEDAMEDASANDIEYNVAYSSQDHTFTIEEQGADLTELRLLWNSGANSAVGAAIELGFDNAVPADNDTGATSYESDNEVVLFTIAAGNNDTINFREVLEGNGAMTADELTAVIPPGPYYDPDDLAAAIEDVMEDTSRLKGNWVDYEVTYSDVSHRFTIKEDGRFERKLEDFALLWGTGEKATTSAAETLGFETIDESLDPPEGETVYWGIFETLFDFKGYLETNDVDGISRTMARLDTHFNSITSIVSDVGVKYNRLEVRKQVGSETILSLTERRSTIEDADYVEALMELKAIETAYEAALNSTSKIIKMSLVNYL